MGNCKAHSTPWIFYSFHFSAIVLLHFQVCRKSNLKEWEEYKGKTIVENRIKEVYNQTRPNDDDNVSQKGCC